MIASSLFLLALHRPVLCQVQVQRAPGVVGTTEQAWEYDGLWRTTRAFDNNEPLDASDDSAVMDSLNAYKICTRKISRKIDLNGYQN